jgi:hypothetical protein
MTRSIASRPSCWAPGGSFTDADWRHVGLVTIGGNDARFEPTLAECTFVQCDRGKRAKRIERRVTNTLPSFLALTYAAIARRAPRATVVVLGYPRIFPGPGQAEPRCFANKLPRARQLFLNRVSSRMRDVIARQARRSGFFFLDVAPTFAGHEPCGPKDDWIFGLSRGLDRGVVSVSPTTPTATVRSYARALRRFLSCVVTSGAALHADGLPAIPGPGRAAPAGCTPSVRADRLSCDATSRCTWTSSASLRPRPPSEVERPHHGPAYQRRLGDDRPDQHGRAHHA